MYGKSLQVFSFFLSLLLVASCFFNFDEEPEYALGIVNSSGLELDIYITTDKDVHPYEFVETVPVGFEGQILSRSFKFNQLYWAEARMSNGTVYAINTWFVDGGDKDVYWWNIN